MRRGEASGVSQGTTSVNPACDSLNLHLETARPAEKPPVEPATPRTEHRVLVLSVVYLFVLCFVFFVFVRGRSEAQIHCLVSEG